MIRFRTFIRPFRLAALGLSIALGVAAFGCESDDNFETAGEDMDEAVDEAGDAVEDAGDEIEDVIEGDG